MKKIKRMMIWNRPMSTRNINELQDLCPINIGRASIARYAGDSRCKEHGVPNGVGRRLSGWCPSRVLYKRREAGLRVAIGRRSFMWTG